MADRTVYLIRHGDTSANADTPGPELERGWKSYPLDDQGRKEAKLIAARLRRFDHPKALISSDLSRAKQTAQIVGDMLGLVPVFDPGLRTWDTGRCAGQLKSKTEPHIADLVRHHPDEPCDGGESFNGFCDRIFKAFAARLKKYPENPIAFIIHARVERLLEATDHFKASKIDVDTFLAKPEQPGHIEKWSVNPNGLSLG